MAIEFIYGPKSTTFDQLDNDLYEIIADADILRANKNYIDALPLYKKAGLLGNVYAMRWAGQIYLEGLSNVGKDYEKALYWYRMGAEQNDRDCIANIGLMYLDGCGVAKNCEKALAFLKRSSNLGNPVASYWIGRMYENNSVITEKPFVEAVKYWNLALAQNKVYSPAMNRLALCYMNGNGVTQDLDKAEQLLKRSMELGNKQANHYYLFDLKTAKEKKEREIAIKRAQEEKKRRKRKERIEICIFFSVAVMFYAATQGILVEVFMPIVLIAVAIGLLIVFIKDQEEKEERHKSQYDTGMKCYHCGSTMVYRMNYDDKRASITFWGSASSKVGMTYHCDSCGREW